MTLTTMMVIYNTKLGCEFVSAALSLTVFYTKKIIYDDNIDNYLRMLASRLCHFLV